MGLLSKRKNKKFDYTPRFYKGEGNPFEIKHKFDEHRTTVGENLNFKQKINNAFDEFKNSPDKAANRRVLVIIAVLIFLFLLLMGFDLSIFFPN
ncbi:riboflavin synthase subunit beta [Psychroserpens sp. NJDZ02]|uniref:riboflavin synthase subunit beta n=1 Tax=Psychroserpens sp. NJDZ02 TaxID=2570561 RepID=UPI0010A7F2A5|nr:riboflavin synthase subunit beta [Psychroserpens sp. NJDZ02]QCE42096.1 riboflavin synthase subunit beta [Psychroserpens sp. NJDZ02]